MCFQSGEQKRATKAGNTCALSRQQTTPLDTLRRSGGDEGDAGSSRLWPRAITAGRLAHLNLATEEVGVTRGSCPDEQKHAVLLLQTLGLSGTL